MAQTPARVPAQVALRGERMLKLLLETTEQGVWFIDNNQITTDANPAMCRLLGLRREELLGRCIFEFVDAENEGIFRDQVRRRALGLASDYEIALTRSDGSQVHCQNRPAPIFDDSGVKIGAVGFFSDISAHKRAAAQIEQARAELAAKTRVLESTLDSLAQGVMSVAPDGRIEACNQQALALMQVPAALLDKPLTLRELIAWQLEQGLLGTREQASDLPWLERAFRLVGGARVVEGVQDSYLRQRNDGRVIEVQLRPSPDGSQVRIYTDVTDTLRAQAALAASESRFRTMADGAPAFIWQADVDGRPVWFNQAWLHCLGRTLEAAVAEPWKSRIHPDDYPLAQRTYLDAVARRVTFETEFRVTAADGRERWIVDHGVPHADGQGRFDGYICYGWDVSARRAAEGSLIAARDEAERANRAKSEFLSRMSHELRTPLNAVLGFAQLLGADREDPLSARQLERVQQILRGGSHLLDLINDVLDMARIEAGALAVNTEAVDVAGVLHACLLLVEPLVQQLGVKLELHALPDAARQALADGTRLRQVMLNLVSNAIKYNRPGGWVHISGHAEADWLRLEVRDSGPGLTVAQQQRLFTAFERLGAERGTVEGTGIGLTLSKALVDLMGGRIGVHSVPGQGSTFWIELPRHQAPTVAAAYAPAAQTLSPAAAGETATVEGLVLYIEDNPVNQLVVESMLAGLPGVRLQLADEPQAGLDRAAAETPDLVLLDIQLPGMDGFEVLERLRRLPGMHQVPVIAVSANALPRDLQHARDAGFDAYVTKPLDMNQLLDAVSRALGRARSRGAAAGVTTGAATGTALR